MKSRATLLAVFFVTSLGSFSHLALAQELHSLRTRNEIANDLLGRQQAPSEKLPLLIQDAMVSGEKKSVALAAAYSLLLPGMGELYVGDYSMGKYFTIAEGALWIGWGGMQWYAHWVQDDARQFAAQHARVSLDGKADQYFIDIGNFQNVYRYNEAVLRGRDAFGTYNPLSASYWQWDTDANREQYRQLRVSSEEAFNNSRFLIAAIGVNHLLSAINAGRLAISHNREIEEASSFDVHANVTGTLLHPHGIVITFTKMF